MLITNNLHKSFLLYAVIAVIISMLVIPSDAQARVKHHSGKKSAGRYHKKKRAIRAVEKIDVSSVVGIAGFETWFLEQMRKYDVTGASVAVAKNGQIVYAKGFGYADKYANVPVNSQTLFRVASVSKAITAVSIIKLCEEGKLSLQDKVFRLLSDLTPLESGTTPDPRIYDITVQQLLQMSGGWNRKRSGDPVNYPHAVIAAKIAGKRPPADIDTTLRYWMGKPLDFDPGTDYAYSNIGYVILGKIIERVSGMPYEKYVKSEILNPMGLLAMRLGKTLRKDRAEGETLYYPTAGQKLRPSLFVGEQGLVSEEYGSEFALETHSADGAWIASASDLVTFITTVAGDNHVVSPSISQASLRLMLSRPTLSHWDNKTEYFGMGWNIVEGTAPIKSLWYRSGSLPGTLAFVARREDAVAVALIVNTRPKNWHKFNRISRAALWRAVDTEKMWN
ncbi:serine hydrolase domain-containing protein [Candidatus Magnetomonas plexicatena]|uniref:serine hydrolase domain-containing protein n=1 Tax=Candidatus Magnetomonas plexicatena TaxID=2552947 RepID=UPI001C775213|nr:beta-lactamase family protein [Nitrospirales bacterium LBB_01]